MDSRTHLLKEEDCGRGRLRMGCLEAGGRGGGSWITKCMLNIGWVYRSGIQKEIWAEEINLGVIGKSTVF